jgi:AcrR family transcriptional regulator
MKTSAGAETRQRLIDAATRAFAENGVDNASLLDIARQTGQRNRGAVHYHFGSRQGLVVAVLEQYAGGLAERQAELVRAVEEAGGDQLEPVLETIVRPITEVAGQGWRGRCFLVVVAELVEMDPGALHEDVGAALFRTGGQTGFGLIRERMPQVSEDLMVERMSLAASFMLRTVADRARGMERGDGRPQLGDERFIANLVAMAAGMLSASATDIP